MTEKRYIKSIISKVEGSKERKKELYEELLKTAEDKLKDGKTLVEVIVEMGKPEEIAEKINEDIPEDEKKKYKKTRIVKRCISSVALIFAVFVLAFIFMPHYSSDVEKDGLFQKETLRNQAMEVITYLDAKEYDKVSAIATDGMKKVLRNDMITFARREQIGDNWGEFKDFSGFQFVQMKKLWNVYGVVGVETKYEKYNVRYNLIFDKNMKLDKMSMELIEE